MRSSSKSRLPIVCHSASVTIDFALQHVWWYFAARSENVEEDMNVGQNHALMVYHMIEEDLQYAGLLSPQYLVVLVSFGLPAYAIPTWQEG